MNGNCETWMVDTAEVPCDTGPIPMGWIPGRRARVVRTSADVHLERYTMRQIPDSIGDACPQESVLYLDFTVLPGTPCVFSGWARKNDGHGNQMKLSIQWYNASHAVVQEDSSSVLVRDATDYVFLTTGKVKAPSHTTFARLRLVILGFGSYDQWDDLQFTASHKRGKRGH